jgi:hypothetical protein
LRTGEDKEGGEITASTNVAFPVLSSPTMGAGEVDRGPCCCRLVTKAVTPPPTKAPAAKIAARIAVEPDILLSRERQRQWKWHGMAHGRPNFEKGCTYIQENLYVTNIIIYVLDQMKINSKN